MMGLVYVDLGDATIAVNVTIAEGARIAAERCGVQVDPLVPLAQEADGTSEDRTVCQTPQGAITLTDNDSTQPLHRERPGGVKPPGVAEHVAAGEQVGSAGAEPAQIVRRW